MENVIRKKERKKECREKVILKKEKQKITVKYNNIMKWTQRKKRKLERKI